jgi:hypothetical protein
VGNCPLG